MVKAMDDISDVATANASHDRAGAQGHRRADRRGRADDGRGAGAHEPLRSSCRAWSRGSGSARASRAARPLPRRLGALRAAAPGGARGGAAAAAVRPRAADVRRGARRHEPARAGGDGRGSRRRSSGLAPQPLEAGAGQVIVLDRGRRELGLLVGGVLGVEPLGAAGWRGRRARARRRRGPRAGAVTVLDRGRRRGRGAPAVRRENDVIGSGGHVRGRGTADGEASPDRRRRDLHAEHDQGHLRGSAASRSSARPRTGSRRSRSTRSSSPTSPRWTS